MVSFVIVDRFFLWYPCTLFILFNEPWKVSLDGQNVDYNRIVAMIVVSLIILNNSGL